LISKKEGQSLIVEVPRGCHMANKSNGPSEKGDPIQVARSKATNKVSKQRLPDINLLGKETDGENGRAHFIHKVPGTRGTN
jgi:hypothetical protein